MNIFQHVRKYANEPETVSELFRFCFLFLFQICFRTVLDVGTFVSSFSFVSVSVSHVGAALNNICVTTVSLRDQ